MPPHKKFKNNFYCIFFLFCSFFLNWFLLSSYLYFGIYFCLLRPNWLGLCLWVFAITQQMVERLLVMVTMTSIYFLHFKGHRLRNLRNAHVQCLFWTIRSKGYKLFASTSRSKGHNYCFSWLLTVAVIMNYKFIITVAVQA